MKELILKSDPRVRDVFGEYPKEFRSRILKVRKIILQVAKDLKDIEELVETLKWGEPSFLPKKRGVGTTVRVHWLKTKPERFGVYFNCQTNLISQFKSLFPGAFRYDGKRAILFTLEDEIPEKQLKECIGRALTYHLGN